MEAERASSHHVCLLDLRAPKMDTMVRLLLRRTPLEHLAIDLVRPLLLERIKRVVLTAKPGGWTVRVIKFGLFETTEVDRSRSSTTARYLLISGLSRLLGLA